MEKYYRKGKKPGYKTTMICVLARYTFSVVSKKINH
jgi:hypothetical protein